MTWPSSMTPPNTGQGATVESTAPSGRFLSGFLSVSMVSFVLACGTETVLRDQAHWILAFDASCGTCREISQVVDVAAEGKLEVLSLSRPDVREWREQFQRYRSAHPGLTAAQRAVLDRAEAIAADPSTHGTAMTEAKNAQFQQLGASARDAFGAEEASVLFASLGPATPGAFGPQQPADESNCTCSTTDDWCGKPNWCSTSRTSASLSAVAAGNGFTCATDSA
jgi:hypothetical protein